MKIASCTRSLLYFMSIFKLSQIINYINELSATVAYQVAHLSKKLEDVGSNPGTGRYIVAPMTTKNGSPLSLGGRLKNLKDVDNGHP